MFHCAITAEIWTDLVENGTHSLSGINPLLHHFPHDIFGRTNFVKTTHNLTNGVTNEFFRAFYDKAENYIVAGSIPMLVLHLAKYQYQNSFAADPEINLVACLTEIMADCTFS